MSAKKPIRWGNRRLSSRLLRNILAVYHTATTEERSGGLYWYRTARSDAQSLAERFAITTEQACGVIAALSPGRDWGKNLDDALRLISAFSQSLPIPAVGSYGKNNIRKSLRILRGEHPLDVLGGEKVCAFYQLINDPEISSLVCIDRHAKGIALGRALGEDELFIRTKAQYLFYSRHYVAAAEQLGLLPHQVQAITWVAWRRAKAAKQLDEIPF